MTNIIPKFYALICKNSATTTSSKYCSDYYNTRHDLAYLLPRLLTWQFPGFVKTETNIYTFWLDSYAVRTPEPRVYITTILVSETFHAVTSLCRESGWSLPSGGGGGGERLAHAVHIVWNPQDPEMQHMRQQFEPPGCIFVLLTHTSK